MTSLEILSLYLPYNLEVECEWVNHKSFLYGIETDGDCCVKIYKLVGDNLIHDCNSHWSSEDVKPHLLPLSMLTEEIEHKGERFVPLDKLKEVTNWCDAYEEWWDYHQPAYKSMMLNCPFEIMIKFLEWHFDVFGLLDKNLAINKILWKAGKL